MTGEMTSKERAQLLKDLRALHADTVEITQARLKENQDIRKQLKAALKNGPATVPELAEATTLPTNVVLWHVMAMKKYDLVNEVGQDAEYYQYALPEVKAK